MHLAMNLSLSHLNKLNQCDEEPLTQIANNAGADGAVVVNRVRQLKSKTEGYDADKDEYGDMLRDSHGQSLLFYDDLADEEGNSDFLDRNGVAAEGDPLSQIEDEQLREALIDAIGKLPEREKLLMGLYYEQELNFKEIAAVLGVTESRVCQLHGQAVSRLRTKLHEWHA